MYLDVKNIGAEGLPVDQTLEVGPLEDVELGPARVVGRVRRLRMGFEFHGRVETHAKLVCSRCLEPVDLQLALPFQLIYREEAGEEESAPAPGAELLVTMEDPVFSELEGGRIHLGQLVEEQVTLALPLKPLCRPDCEGLCPQCGARRSAGDCGCRPTVDPRLEVLRDLKERLDRS